MEAGITFKENEHEGIVDVPYQKACGHVLWLAVISWPDVQFAIDVFAWYI